MAGPLIVPSVADLPSYEGRDLGASDWFEVDQARIDRFAEATGDHQWIHVDPERAQRESPFGGTIAHGYLTLSIAPALLPSLVHVEGCAQIVNSGIENLRLREPVPAGACVRLAATIGKVRTVPGGAARVSLSIRIEVQDRKKAAATGELVFVYFPEAGAVS